MNTKNKLTPFANPETSALPETFMVWELTAIYRRLGLAARAAESAAVADLRTLFVNVTQIQEEAA